MKRSSGGTQWDRRSGWGLRLLGIVACAAVATRLAWAEEARPAGQRSAPGAWQPLFDGKTLERWQTTLFGGEGDVYVEQGELRLGFGSSMTGVTYTGDDLPRQDYELRLEARRLDGTDFFCGLTFPVGERYLTLIVGGWGGAVVGLSSLDGEDASTNETRRTMSFRKGEWYRIRLKVAHEHVSVWINDEPIIDQSLKGRELSLRAEVELCKPLGIAAWDTSAALRKIELRRTGGAASDR